MDPGAEIKELRIKLGLSQEKLGNLLGVTNTTVYKLEHNLIKDKSLYQQYLDALNAHVDQANLKQFDQSLLANAPEFVARIEQVSKLYDKDIRLIFQQAGINRQILGRYRSGQNKVAITTAERLANALGIPLEDLLDTSISPAELVERYPNKTVETSQDSGIIQDVKSFIAESRARIPNRQTSTPEMLAAHLPKGFDYSMLDDNGQELMSDFFNFVLQLCPAKANASNE